MSVRARFWLVTAATVVTVSVTASLGLWQLGRADQKRQLQSQIEQRMAQPALSTAQVVSGGGSDTLLHRAVTLRGTWLYSASVFLDNRPMAGRSGFILVTPLQLQGAAQAVLVQRGWVPRDFVDRNRVPDVDAPAGVVEVSGRLAPAPSRLLELGAGETGRIRQNLDVEAFAREVGLTLMPLSVLQTGPSPEGLLREWPRFEADVPKHLGYAAQWFAMSALAAGLYVWFQLICPRRRRIAHGQDSR
ncbi:MAG: SURF1 family protein [Hydrogenophaga sp.]|nr:SURF1 family protein [Hydrogenophaga sp.]